MTKLWKTSLSALALALGISALGCVGDGVVRAEYGVSATYSEPSLAYVGNGLWVVEDYPYPVFYDSGSYWAYRNGVWLRGASLGNWIDVRYDYVPSRLRRVYRPQVYVHYRARPGVRVRYGTRGRVIVRDSGDYRRRYRTEYRRSDRRDRYDYRRDRYYRDRDRRWRD